LNGKLVRLRVAGCGTHPVLSLELVDEAAGIHRLQNRHDFGFGRLRLAQKNLLARRLLCQKLSVQTVSEWGELTDTWRILLPLAGLDSQTRLLPSSTRAEIMPMVEYQKMLI
jgi:hypothetical protein